MTEPVAGFFDGLAERQPLLATITGTLRFDLEHAGGTEHTWLVAVRRGALRVSDRNAKADCVVRMDRKLFGGIAAGRIDPMTVMLRGVVEAQGDKTLLVRFQRLFPGPSSSNVDAGSDRGRTGS